MSVRIVFSPQNEENPALCNSKDEHGRHNNDKSDKEKQMLHNLICAVYKRRTHKSSGWGEGKSGVVHQSI